MNTQQKQSIEAYQRVQAFLADHPLPPPGSYGPAKDLLDDVVARLTSHSADQMTGGRLIKAETRRLGILRRTLRELHLRPIAKIANAVLRGSPGIDQATRMPQSNLTATRLLAEAGAFRQAAAPYEETFVHHGRPADFLARLDAATEELRQAQLDKARRLGTKVGARAGIHDEIMRGRQAVELLDAIVTTSFVGNGELLAKWRSAKRLRGTGGGNTTGEQQQPASAPSPAPAESQVA